jgi:ketosteroid isomerase-like protein
MIRGFVFITLSMLVACKNNNRLPSAAVNEKIILMQTDKAFSEMSIQKGMKAAFIEYIDSNGVLLKPNQLPIVGANAIDYLIGQSDTSFTLNWQPHNAFVSKSADLGYTYGVYALHPKYADTVLYGTYVSIWKKQGDGRWKFVLDSGNEGIDSIITDF